MILSVRAAAEERPDGDALVSGAGILSWAGLADRVLAEAAALRRSGIEGTPGAGPAADRPPVGLSVPIDLQTVVRLLALIELGVPFSPLHPRLTAAERAVLQAGLGPALEIPLELPGASSRAPGGTALPARAPDDERPLALVHSSGSEGAPRAAVLSRRAFAAAAGASAARLGWRTEDRWLLCLSPARIGGLSILTRCLAGRRAVVLPESLDPAAIAEALVVHRVTIASLVPTQLLRLLELVPEFVPSPSLRAVLLGGAPAPAPLLAEARSRRIPVLPTWGMTETCAQAATVPPGTAPDPSHGCGPPLPGIEIRIESGRIAVRGRTLFSGYLGEPRGGDATGGAFTAEGWFLTRDLGRIDEHGYLFVLGRSDEVVISGGEKIAPREVEELLEAAPGVAGALVFGVPDPELGQALAAALVPAPGYAGADREIAAFLAARLAPFKRPRLVAWVDRLPETAAGKPDRHAARALLTDHLRPFDR